MSHATSRLIQESPYSWMDTTTANTKVRSTTYRTVANSAVFNGELPQMAMRHIEAIAVGCAADGTEVNLCRTVIKQTAVVWMQSGVNTMVNDGLVVPRDGFLGYTPAERRGMIEELALWTPPTTVGPAVYLD